MRNVIKHMNNLGFSDELQQSRTPPEEGAVGAYLVCVWGKRLGKGHIMTTNWPA
jgi:hypothetical protein